MKIDWTKTSWRTTALGIACIIWGLWCAYVHYVPNQTLYFHLAYVWTPEECLILLGVGLIHAADHKNLPPPPKV
jgi:hypothetical protein